MEYFETWNPQQASAFLDTYWNDMLTYEFALLQGCFFDYLIDQNIPVYPSPENTYQEFLECAAFLVRFPEKLNNFYKDTPCETLYEFYRNYFKLQTHLSTLANPISVPSGDKYKQFVFLMGNYIQTL